MSFYSEKFFPIANDVVTGLLLKHRKKILSMAQGKVLEIGFGSGQSIGCYPDAVSEVVGLEPNPGMLAKAQKKNDPKLKLISGVAEKLPFADQEFDGVVSFMTLCSVSDFAQTIREIKRVLKPDGKLFFIEHVAQPQGSVTRSIQKFVQPAWGCLACGCHIDRDTLTELETQGFKLHNLKTIGYSGFPNFLGPLYRGYAVQ